MSGPVVVAGGGIAGAGLGLALHRAGIEVVVCEAAGPDADTGAFLTLADAGMRALAALRADDAVAAASGPMTLMRMLDADGHEQARRTLGGERATTAFRYLTRATLAGTLRAEATARGVPIRYGTRVTGAVPDPDGVTVHLAGGSELRGSELRGSLLVGADGLRSPVRGLVDPGGPPPRPVGQRVYYGYTPGHAFPDVGDFHVVRHPAAAFGAVPARDGSTWWFARVDTPLPPPPPDADPRAAVLERLDVHPGRPSRLAADARRVLAVDAHDLAYAGPWYRDRMVLVGDAAHAAAPATGMGASMALEDAVVLGKALREHPGDPATAAAAYERARRGRTQANLVASARGSRPDVALDDADPGDQPPADVLAGQMDWDRPLR